MEHKVIAAGVLPVCAKTGRILLIQRGPSQGSAGKWACFGGKLEHNLDLNPKEAAKREFAEESRFSGRYKISSTPLYVNNSNHLDFYTYVGVFDEEFTPDIAKENEASDYGWFYLGETPWNLLPGFKEALDKKTQTLQNLICFFSKNC